MFYAGYESIDTDVAVFETKQQRDNWLSEWSVFKPFLYRQRKCGLLWTVCPIM